MGEQLNRKVPEKEALIQMNWNDVKIHVLTSSNTCLIQNLHEGAEVVKEGVKRKRGRMITIAMREE